MKVQHKGDYRVRRVAEYPPLADQLDAMWKILANLPQANIPEEARVMMAKIVEVKARYPKPG